MKRTSRLRQRTRLKKQSKQPISRLQRKLWNECRRIIRKRYGNVCYTCGKTGLGGSNWQTGHMWAKASVGAFLKYDLRILRPQCYRCNIHGGGMGADFFLRMWEENGPEYMERLKADRQKTVVAYDHYEKLLKDYEQL